MSGGIAYVLDEDGGFAGRCNHELVDLEGLEPEDAEVLWALVDEHRERTGSPVAERVLARFDELLPSFVKVMPRDYRAALAAIAAGTEELAYPDDRPISSGGEGFVTAEVESGSSG
jgi:glutamate synthase domain-containing protein 3